MIIYFLNKNFSSITRKSSKYDMESCYKNITKIRNDTFIFQIFEKNQERKKREKIPIDSA